MTHRDITITSCQDMTCCEIEDMIKVDVYNEFLIDKYNVNFKESRFFNNKREEWSKRMKNAFDSQGQPYTDLENFIKEKIADFVVAVGYEALYPHRTDWIKALADSLETKIDIESK